MSLEEFRAERHRIEELKKEIPNIYNSLLYAYGNYKRQYLKNNALLDVLYYELENVKGIDYTREKRMYNKDASIEKYYSISDRIAEVEKENSFILKCLKAIETIINGVQDKEVRAKATECYFNNLFC